MLKVLVTGYTGFIGSHLAKALLGRGHVVYGTGTPGENEVPGVIDLGRELSGIPDHILKNVSVLFHQAADNDTQSSNRQVMARTNCDEPAYLFDRAYVAGCRNFVYASTAAVYGDQPVPWSESTTGCRPLTDYAFSKARFEGFASSFSGRHHCNVVGLRYCNVYGPGEDHKGTRASMIHQLGRQIMTHKAVLFDNGEQRRDWVYVQDVVRANLLAARRGFRRDWSNDPYLEANQILNISSGQTVTFNQLVKLLDAKLGTDTDPTYIPNPYPSTYQNYTCSAIDRADQVLGWRPRYGIRRGISAMVTHWFNTPGYLVGSD